MANLSYNEAAKRQLKLKHIFFPNAYALISETIIAFLLLVLLNLGELNSRIFIKNFQSNDALPLWEQHIRSFLNAPENYHGAEQVMLFVLWAIIGAVLYIVAFRLLQALFGVKQSVSLGLYFAKQDHASGILHWLASLHDFFLKLLIVISGGIILGVGAIFCFGIASQELRNGLDTAFPANIGEFAVSVLAAILSVRLIGIGVSLLSRRFRDWYTA